MNPSISITELCTAGTIVQGSRGGGSTLLLRLSAILIHPWWGG